MSKRESKFISKFFSLIQRQLKDYSEIFISEFIEEITAKSAMKEYRDVAGFTRKEMRNAIRKKLFIFDSKFICKFTIFCKCETVICKKIIAFDELEDINSNPELEILSIDLYSIASKKNSVKSHPDNHRRLGIDEVRQIVRDRFEYLQEAQADRDSSEIEKKAGKRKTPNIQESLGAKASKKKPTKKVNQSGRNKKGIFSYFQSKS